MAAKPKAKSKAKPKAEAKRLQQGDMESDGPLAKAACLQVWGAVFVVLRVRLRTAHPTVRQSGDCFAYTLFPLQEDREDCAAADACIPSIAFVFPGSMTFRACCSTRSFSMQCVRYGQSDSEKWV